MEEWKFMVLLILVAVEYGCLGSMLREMYLKSKYKFVPHPKCTCKGIKDVECDKCCKVF